MQKIYPLYDHVVVEPLQAKEKTEGGIVLPDAARQTQAEGIVIAVGCGKITANGNLVEPRVKPGDHVLYGQRAIEINMNNKKYQIMSESSILAVVKSED